MTSVSAQSRGWKLALQVQAGLAPSEAARGKRPWASPRVSGTCWRCGAQLLGTSARFLPSCSQGILPVCFSLCACLWPKFPLL